MDEKWYLHSYLHFQTFAFCLDTRHCTHSSIIQLFRNCPSENGLDDLAISSATIKLAFIATSCCDFTLVKSACCDVRFFFNSSAFCSFCSMFNYSVIPGVLCHNAVLNFLYYCHATATTRTDRFSCNGSKYVLSLPTVLKSSLFSIRLIFAISRTNFKFSVANCGNCLVDGPSALSQWHRQSLLFEQNASDKWLRCLAKSCF